MVPIANHTARESLLYCISMRKLHILIANLIFVIHCLLGVFILVGWLFPKIKFLYLAVLSLLLVCWVFLGYCPLSRWEFSLRKKHDKSIDQYAESIKYYMYKFFKKDIPAQAIFNWGLVVFIVLTILSLAH